MCRGKKKTFQSLTSWGAHVGQGGDATQIRKACMQSENGPHHAGEFQRKRNRGHDKVPQGETPQCEQGLQGKKVCGGGKMKRARHSYNFGPPSRKMGHRGKGAKKSGRPDVQNRKGELGRITCQILVKKKRGGGPPDQPARVPSWANNEDRNNVELKGGRGARGITDLGGRSWNEVYGTEEPTAQQRRGYLRRGPKRPQ